MHPTTPWGDFREELDKLARQYGLTVQLAPCTEPGKVALSVEGVAHRPAPQGPPPMTGSEIRRHVRDALLEVARGQVPGTTPSERVAACDQLIRLTSGCP